MGRMGWVWKFPRSAKFKSRQELKDTKQKRLVPWCEKRNVMRCLLNVYISNIDSIYILL